MLTAYRLKGFKKFKSLRVQGFKKFKSSRVQEFEDIRENLKFFLSYSQKFVILQP